MLRNFCEIGARSFYNRFTFSRHLAEPCSGKFRGGSYGAFNHIFIGRQEMAKQIRRLIATALAFATVGLTSSAAMAQSYTGNWPATVTQAQRFNGAYCVTLTDNGSYGPTHSGPAVLDGTPDPYGGYFTVIGGLITITFPNVSGPGDCCDFFVFSAHANNGKITNGAFNYFGVVDDGLVAFGKKNSCTP
jgi:hypothetical protein